MTSSTFVTSVSVGHVAFIGEFEFFTVEDGNLYRARKDRGLDVNGYRQGARWEAPPHMVENTLSLHREVAAIAQ